MSAIYSSTLAQCARLAPVPGSLSLQLWLRALQGQLLSERAEARPVPMTQAEAARLLGRDVRTIRRAWPQVLQLWTPTPAGLVPAEGAWADPWADQVDGKRPAFRFLGDAALSLISLGREGWSALRLFCELLRRKGTDHATWSPRRELCDALGMGATAFTSAMQRLVRLNLVVSNRAGGIYRVMRRVTVAVQNVRPSRARTQRDHGPGRNGTAPFRGGEDELQEQQARPAARAVVDTLRGLIPGLSRTGARELARGCSSPEQAERWVAAEGERLSRAVSPAGLLRWLFRKGLSSPTAPGRRSPSAYSPPAVDESKVVAAGAPGSPEWFMAKAEATWC